MPLPVHPILRMRDRIVVNIFGAPNDGKTVAAASLFTRLKKLHIPCELVAEFPKDMVLENNHVALNDQIFIAANQLYRIKCAYNNTKIAIVDSPILLSTIYNPLTSVHLTNMIFEQHGKFNNLNLLVQRGEYEHSMEGRIHTEEESDLLRERIVAMLNANNIPYLEYDDSMEEEVVSLILESVDS